MNWKLTVYTPNRMYSEIITALSVELDEYLLNNPEYMKPLDMLYRDADQLVDHYFEVVTEYHEYIQPFLEHSGFPVRIKLEEINESMSL